MLHDDPDRPRYAEHFQMQDDPPRPGVVAILLGAGLVVLGMLVGALIGLLLLW